MTRFNNPLASKFSRLKSKSAEIKCWVRELMNLPEDCAISVTELVCHDEGCPDVETVIGILETGKPIVAIRVHNPMHELTKASVGDAVRSTPEAWNNQLNFRREH